MFNSFLLFVLLASSVLAHAQAVTTMPSVVYGPSGGTLRPGSMNTVATAYRSFAANSAVAGEVIVKDAISTRVGSANAAMYTTRAIPWVGIARGAAVALPVLGTAALAYALYDGVRCKADPNGGSTGLLCDPGQAQTMILQWCGQTPTGGVTVCGASASAAASAIVARYKQFADQSSGANSLTYSLGTQYTGNSSQAGYNVASVTVQGGVTTTNPSAQTFVVTASSALGCTTGGVGADGKCQTGAFNPKTFAEAADLLPVPLPGADVIPLLKELLEKGVDLAPVAVPLPATGPAFVVGPVTTSVFTPVPTAANPNPVPVTETVQPKHNITYGPDPDDYSYTDTQIKTNQDGTVETDSPPLVECGIPGKSPCNVKVDETGTKDKGDLSAAEAALDAAKAAANKEIEDSAKRTSLPWSWSWALPQGACTPFTFGTDAHPMTVDPCSAPGVGLWRSLLSWMLGIMTGLYIWRSVTELGA